MQIPDNPFSVFLILCSRKGEPRSHCCVWSQDKDKGCWDYIWNCKIILIIWKNIRELLGLPSCQHLSLDLHKKLIFLLLTWFDYGTRTVCPLTLGCIKNRSTINLTSKGIMASFFSVISGLLCLKKWRTDTSLLWVWQDEILRY